MINPEVYTFKTIFEVTILWLGGYCLYVSTDTQHKRGLNCE